MRRYQRKKDDVAEGKLYTMNRKVGNYTESLGGEALYHSTYLN